MQKTFKNHASRLRSRSKGFTLIELLVVIAVIALLATVAVVALNNARTKSRDAKRVADLKQIQNGLGMYYDANKDLYPSITNEIAGLQNLGFFADSSCDGDNAGDKFIESDTGEWLVEKGIMASMPDDPKNKTEQECYLYVHSKDETAGATKVYLVTTKEDGEIKKCPGLVTVPQFDTKYCIEIH